MYEVFKDDNGRTIETGEILFANLKLSGMDNSLYFLIKKGVKVTMIKVVKVLKSLNEDSINGARLLLHLE